MKKCKTTPFAWHRVDVGGSSDCWPWRGALNRWGYGACQLNGKQMNASRAAYIDTHGEPSPGLVVCHTCDNPACCNPAHLFPATQAQNLADCRSKGRSRGGFGKGANHPRHTAKLSVEQVRAVRRRHKAGESQSSIARDLGVNSTTISALVRGVSYRSVA